MTIHAHPEELAEGYEALRAQALGVIGAQSCRGLAVFMRGGLPAFMHAAAPAARPTPPPLASNPREPSSLDTELVRVLAEMVVCASRRRG